MIAIDALGPMPVDQLSCRDLLLALNEMEDAADDPKQAARYARQALEIDPAAPLRCWFSLKPRARMLSASPS